MKRLLLSLLVIAMPAVADTLFVLNKAEATLTMIDLSTMKCHEDDSDDDDLRQSREVHAGWEARARLRHDGQQTARV